MAGSGLRKRPGLSTLAARFAAPYLGGVNGHRARLAVALIVVVLVGGACADSSGTATTSTAAAPPVATPTSSSSAPATTTPVTTPSTTAATPATTAGAPALTQQEAYQVVFNFDPATGDPEILAAALEVAGAGPGLGLPMMIERGSAEVQGVVFAHLANSPTWALPTLVAMQAYGMPSGTYDAPRLWPSAVQLAISEALAAAANSGYGSLGEVMVDLNRHMVKSEVEACAQTGCSWGEVWYTVPQAVTRPEGTMTDAMLFEGAVTVVSDTGAGDVYPVTLQRFDNWVPIEGLLAERPAFGLMALSPGVFDGAIVTDSSVTLAGWGVSGATVAVGSRETTIVDNWWELSVTVGPEDILDLVCETADGRRHAELIRVSYLPTAETTFGFIVGQTTVDGSAALIVDYAEWLSGEAATAAAREDGVIGPEDFIENDFYIRNRNDQLRTLPVIDGARVRLIDATVGSLTPVTVPATELLRMLETGDDIAWYGAASPGTPYWFIVDQEGVIHQAQQQYVP